MTENKPEAAPRPVRPYRNLDVWPRARAMLASAEEPLSVRQIADALGVRPVNVFMAFECHKAEVHRISGRPYRWKLRSREAA